MADVHTREDLKMMQSLPLSVKVRMTEERIRGWVREYGEDGVYVAFSGGKDSTVLLHIARRLYPNLKAAFSNTSNEYPEVVKFVKTFDNVDIVTPKMGFRQVILKHGYPVISKEVSECVCNSRKFLDQILQADGGGITNTEISSIELLARAHIDARLNNQPHQAQLETDKILGICERKTQEAILAYADKLSMMPPPLRGGQRDQRQYRILRGLGVDITQEPTESLEGLNNTPLRLRGGRA